ncbi:hypothetical protein JHD48_08500 [Sulfurimonas sp. SAG-AH-194-I05]|nr:hypothetical protein [Sulfurimonas sp. SAG-AH-194-I05]MDF1875774.1 hypothetical protein [Sulfurimonas sp. SAG-AH-194-I05]
MADKNTQRYLELQMKELKESIVDDSENKTSVVKKNKNQDANAEMARIYEDAAEYEADLQCFEDELEIIQTNALKNIASVLEKELPDDDRNYTEELKNVLIAGWTHSIENQDIHSKEQLDLIHKTDFIDAVGKLNTSFPEYNGDFEKDVRDILNNRWGNLIALKKEHVKEELDNIKTMGLKPKYVKRAYEQFHGLRK